MLRFFQISSTEYQSRKPYPHYWCDDALDFTFAKQLQNEILTIPLDQFDRYNNPFEQKYTLRDKFNYPPLLNKLFTYLESSTFVENLSQFVGYKLNLDVNRNYNGVHIYDNGDKLDIHVDAGIHPVQKLKKRVTLGLYLSYNWNETYGCELEIWKGGDSSDPNVRLTECVTKIAPMFNRMVIFTNTDNSWHGNPTPVLGNPDSKRIFVTISYLSTETDDCKNKLQKAYFIKRPNDPEDPEKDKLRSLRANATLCTKIYRINDNKSENIGQ